MHLGLELKNKNLSKVLRLSVIQVTFSVLSAEVECTYYWRYETKL